VADEDWARRSQQNLEPVTVGRITIVPRSDASSPHPQPLTIVIEPSMGFGTGHHATTRLCLAALQRTALTGAFVLDVGTGSGILAIAAARLGAAAVLGVDSDADAIRSANGNLELNPGASGIRFTVADVAALPLPRADVITANLTGALLARVAGLLLEALTPEGSLILSGILAEEEGSVRRAFSAAEGAWRQQDEEWIGLILTTPARAVK
jgi:ribosomal protein L11 methyltransferase